MGKYIVELESGTHIFVLGPEGIVHIGEPDVVYGTVDGMQIGDAVINAKPYTEPDLERVRKEAYDKGYDDAKGGYENGFENGMIVAWDAARKIDHMSDEDIKNVFGCGFSAVFETIGASECIEKIRQYEQRQEEQIQVGDEVIRHYKNEFMEGDDAPSIFLSEEDGHFRCLAFNGRSIMIAEYPKNQYRKTGRHFPEIATVLEKMRGEQDG